MFVLFITAVQSFGQGSGKLQSTTGKGLIYSTEKAALLGGRTNGIDVGYEWGVLKTYYKTTFYKVNLGFIRHPKEVRTNPQGFFNSAGSSYFYGKRNSFWQLRGAWGEKRYLSEKDAYRGVAVGYSYSFGPTLGLLKPYYLILNTGETSPNRFKDTYIKYTDKNAADFMNKEKIAGSAPFFTGIKELGVVPGGHFNLGAHFDWGAYDDFVRALEVGVAVDLFVKKVPILVNNTQNRAFFTNLYVNLQFGKRK